MVKLVCKFEVEISVGEENRERFNICKLNGFKEMRNGIIEMLQDNSDNLVNILEFDITED